MSVARSARARTALAAIGPELECVDDDLGAVILLAALFVIPGARLQTTLDIDRATLLHVLRDDLGGAAERDDIVELRHFLLLPVLVFKDAIGSHAEIRNLPARRERLQLGIAGEIAVEEDFVEVHV